MARTYELSRSTFVEKADRPIGANVDALKTAVDKLPGWSVGKTAEYAAGGPGHSRGTKKAPGENKQLAIELLRAKGNDSPTSRQISSQMKSVQRWRAQEEGKSSQSRNLSKASRDLLNQVGRNRQLAKDGFSVKLNGELAINGYKRPRKAAVDLDNEDLAQAFLDNPNFQDLGRAYLGGEDSLYGYGDDLQVEIITE